MGRNAGKMFWQRNAETGECRLKFIERCRAAPEATHLCNWNVHKLTGRPLDRGIPPAIGRVNTYPNQKTLAGHALKT